MTPTLLLLTPLSERATERHHRVAAALERAGFAVRDLTEIVNWQTSRRGSNFIPGPVAMKAIKAADKVVVLPRPDGSIGRGTRRDLQLAEKSGTPTFVVGPKAQLIRLQEAGLILADGTQRVDARFSCYDTSHDNAVVAQRKVHTA